MTDWRRLIAEDRASAFGGCGPSELMRYHPAETERALLTVPRELAGLSWSELERASGWDARIIRRAAGGEFEPRWGMVRDVIEACGCRLFIEKEEGQ